MNPKTRSLIIIAVIFYHLAVMAVIYFMEGMLHIPKLVRAVVFLPQFYGVWLIAQMITDKRPAVPAEEIQRGLPGGRPQDRTSAAAAALRQNRKTLDQEAEEAFEPVRLWGSRVLLSLLGIVILWYYVKFVF